MTDVQKPIVMNNFQKAVADSPNLGHAKMQNIDIEMFPGSMKVQKRMRPAIMSINGAQTVTWTAGSQVLVCPLDMRTQAEIDTGNTTAGAAVYFTSTGTLPAGLTANQIYYIFYVSPTTFHVSSDPYNAYTGASYNSVTDAGTGTHTIHPVTTSTVFTYIKKDLTTGYVYAIDTNGRVWNTFGADINNPNLFFLLYNSGLDTNPANPLLQAFGNGLQIFRVSDASKTYLFAFRTYLIDVIEITAKANLISPSWTNGWASGFNSPANSNNPHFSILGQDNIIYICDDRYLTTIVENAGSVFAPGSAGTYTFNNQALDLPLNEIAGCLEELTTNKTLLVGGLTFNKIYPWDRLSPSFNLPLWVPEKGIYRMKNLGNIVYIFAGRKGNIYTTQGTFVKVFKTIPGYIKNPNSVLNNNTTLTWGDVGISNGALLFGINPFSTPNAGLYRLYPDGRLVQDNVPYNGPGQINAIYCEDEFYMIGTFGDLEYSDTSRPVAGTYQSVYHSPLYRVGDKTHKGTVSQFEIQTGSPASSGNMRVGYRFDKTSSFVTTAASTFSANGVDTSFQNSEMAIENIENIQFQLEFDAEVEIIQMTATP